LTLHQAEAFAIVACMLGLFVWDRLRYDVIAGMALSAAALLGVVPREKAFEGFANPVIIIIASVLVIGRAVAVSGVIEAATRLGGDFISAGLTAALEQEDPIAAVNGIAAFWRTALRSSDFAIGCPVVAATVDGGRTAGTLAAARESFALAR